MENIAKFQLDHLIASPGSTVAIGSIDGKRAIYIPQGPEVDLTRLSASTLEVEKASVPLSYTARLIYPATEQHVAKYLKKYKYSTESFEEYRSNDSCLKTSWLDNILSAKAEREHVHLETEKYLIISDYKWDQKSMAQLYLLMIFKNDGLRSIRNLNESHIGLLRDARKDILAYCKSLGLERRQLCLFFHYRPSYFRLHVHIVNIEKGISKLGSPSRLVLLDDVIANLELDGGYFTRNMHFITQDDVSS